MNALLGLNLLVGGFMASAEFGSVAFVHPVIRRLPAAEHVQVEQGLLRIFGRVMPVLMTLTAPLASASAVSSRKPLLRAAALSSGAALASTIAINVPINRATATWDAQIPPPGWKAARNRWEGAQAVQASLFLLGFALSCLSVADQEV